MLHCLKSCPAYWIFFIHVLTHCHLYFDTFNISERFAPNVARVSSTAVATRLWVFFVQKLFIISSSGCNYHMKDHIKVPRCPCFSLLPLHNFHIFMEFQVFLSLCIALIFFCKFEFILKFWLQFARSIVKASFQPLLL